MRPAEVLVIDNASTDGSVALLEREFPAARIIKMQKNDGPCPARNRGMEEARTPLVLALDCDIILPPNCIQKLAAAFGNNAALAVAAPRAIPEEAREFIQYDGAYFHYVGLLALRNFYVRAERADGRGTVDVDAYVSMAALVDREKLLKVGGYDPAFFILFEDSDLSYRLRSAGFRIVCIEDATVIHRGGTEGTSFRAGLYPSRRVFLHSRNRWLFIMKNYQWFSILRGIPGLFIYEIVAILFALAKLAPIAYIHGKCSFLYYLPSALRARRSTRARQIINDREFIRGGPLTLWPPLRAGAFEAAAARALDATLQLCWRALGGRP